MTPRWRHLPKFLLLPILIYLLYAVRRQTVFEHFLKSSSITFDDFPTDYAKALIDAQLLGRNPIYQWTPSTVLESEAQTTIPPIIHFSWFQNIYHEHLDVSKIPEVGSRAPELCRNHNPDFEIHEWNITTARDLLEKHYSWFLPTYDAYRYPIQQIDAFKYFVLWHYGGVYMDLDISCRRPLDPLLPFPAWYPKASPFGVNNDLMASRARHPLLGIMLENLTTRNKNLLFPYLTIFWSTGPMFTSDMLKRWFYQFKGQQYVQGTSKKDYNEDMTYVLPDEFYSEKYTFFGHSPGGTWHGEDVAVVLWLVDRPWVFAIIPLLLVFVYACALRSRGFYRSKCVDTEYQSL